MTQQVVIYFEQRQLDRWREGGTLLRNNQQMRDLPRMVEKKKTGGDYLKEDDESKILVTRYLIIYASAIVMVNKCEGERCTSCVPTEILPLQTGRYGCMWIPDCTHNQ